MPETTLPSDPRDNTGSRTLVFVILGIIVAAILAFLVLRPNPSGTATHKTTATPAAH